MNLSDVAVELLERQPESDMVPTLDRVAQVMAMLGDPQHSFRVIHVTGTNGKTSTARMMDALVRASGLRTGLFTSPHLHSMTERVVIDGSPLTDEAFVAAYQDVAPYIAITDQQLEIDDQPGLTFFEALTCIALAAFADAPVEVAIVEVGLGGTWDATNVADADVAVVTPIDYDHTNWLGAELAQIAGEKAGIIKPGSSAVLAGQPPEASEVLLARCLEVGVDPFLEGVAFGVQDRSVALGGQLLNLRGIAGDYEDVFLPLYGAHQANNAALAVAAVEALLSPDQALGEDVVAGLSTVVSPARLEIVSRRPTVIVDAAHNPAGARSLAIALPESFTLDRVVGVVSIMSDKDVSGILRELQPVLNEVVFTQSSSPRALPAAELARIARADGIWTPERIHVANDLAEALELAEAMADQAAEATAADGEGPRPQNAVLVAGSVVLASDVRAAKGAPPVPAAPVVATIEAEVDADVDLDADWDEAGSMNDGLGEGEGELD